MTIFSKIIAGEIPSHKIAENDKFYAFLDINPVALGHTLVVPKTRSRLYLRFIRRRFGCNERLCKEGGTRH